MGLPARSKPMQYKQSYRTTTMTTTMVLSKLPSEGLLPGSSACTSLPPHCCLSNLSSTSPHFTAVLFISLNAAVVLINHSCQTERDQSLCFFVMFLSYPGKYMHTHTFRTDLQYSINLNTSCCCVVLLVFQGQLTPLKDPFEKGGAISGNAQLSLCICPLSHFQRRTSTTQTDLFIRRRRGFPPKTK